MSVRLSTPRLELRELLAQDLDFVASMPGDPLVMRFHPRRLTRAEAWGWLVRQQERYARDGNVLWLLSDRASGAPIGQAGLLLQVVEGEALPGIGYLVHHTFWGRGYATEAAIAVGDWAFAERGYPRVIPLIRPENAPSRRVAKRVGMRWWRSVPHAGLPHDVFSLAPGLAHADIAARASGHDPTHP